MGSKNFVKAARGTHPTKSGNFSGSSVIKYSFLLLKFLLKLPHIFVKFQVLATKPSHDLYDSYRKTTSVPRGIKRGRVCVQAQIHVNKPSVMIGSDEADAWFAAVGPMERPLW